MKNASRTLPTSLFLALATSVASAQGPLECDGDTCRLTVHEYLAFETASETLLATPGGGFELNGAVTLSTPWVDLPVPFAQLSFQPVAADGPLAFEVIGTAQLDMTALPGVGQYFTSGPIATFGVATREVLRELLETGDTVLPLPENADPDNPGELLEPAYVFFRFETGVQLDLPLAEALGIESEFLGEKLDYELPEAAATLVFDPTDPFFYFAMDEMLSSEDEDEEQDDESNEPDGSDDDDGDLKYELNALAFSWQGGIPFEPDTSWGLPEGAGELSGNVLLDGSFTIYGVEIEGQVVVGTILDGQMELAANCEATLGLEADGVGVNLPLGEASLAIEVAPFDIQIAFSGELDIAEIEVELDGVAGGLLPEEIPLGLTGQAHVAGYIHQNGLGFYEAGYHAEGEFVAAPYGLETWSLGVAGSLDLDGSGYFLQGSLTGSLHPALQFDGEVSVEASFPFHDLDGWSMSVHGKLSVGGVDLGVANVLVNAQGIFIDGAYNTPISQILLVGELTANGPYLAGYASVNLGEQGVGQLLVAAQAAVANAQAALASIDEEMATLVALIEGERAFAQAGIDQAQSAVYAAQGTVASLQASIDYQHSMISTRQSQINWWWHWANGQPWWNAPWAWGVYAAESGWRNADIAARVVTIASLTVAKTAATAALGVAEGTLQIAESALDAFPIELDARVVAVQVLREAALIALDVAEQVLAAAPPLPENLMAELAFELDSSGLSGTASVALEETVLFDGYLAIGEYIELSVDLAVIGEVSLQF